MFVLVVDKKEKIKINVCYIITNKKAVQSSYYLRLQWVKFLHKKRVQLPQDWFGTPTWSTVTSCEIAL